LPTFCYVNLRTQAFSLSMFSELTMKIIAAVPFALLTLATLGCTQHASTAPAVDRPAAAASSKNTFGESKDEAAGSAASARAANYGAEPAPAAESAPASGTAPEATPPK
jgi:hypothetical protein